MKKYDFAKNLFITLDDKELINVSKTFLLDIEKNFENFKEEYNKSHLDWKDYINNNNFVFEPEKLSKKSPLTIINAPWGTGKTFFIENFIKLFIDKKIESIIFKKIIIIDAWKFSNSKDVPVEFAIELSKKIVGIHITNESKKTEKVIMQKILDWIIPDSLKWKVNFHIFSLEGTHTNKSLTENKEEEEANKIWTKIQKNTEPTIIFIDNLERLGSSSWDLLKAILKIQEFDNYLIVLPLNLSKFKNNKKVDNSEYPIEKYIDFNHYNLEQDYSNFFNKYIKEEQRFINKLNLIFNSEIEGEKLSIRQVENSFKKHNLFKTKDKYEILKTIRNHIWYPEEIFNNFLKDDAKYFLEIERKKCDLFLEISNKISEKDEKGKFINISEFNLKDKNNIFSWENNQRFWYQTNFDYLNDYKDLLNKINFKKNENLKKIQEITESINNLNQDKKTLEEKKNSLENEISELEKKEEIEKKKIEDYSTEEHNKIQNKLSLAGVKLEEIEEKIEDIQIKIENYNNDLIFFNENNDKIFNISNKITELENINSDDKLSKNQKEEILEILNSNFEKLHERIHKGENLDLSKISL